MFIHNFPAKNEKELLLLSSYTSSFCAYSNYKQCNAAPRLTRKQYRISFSSRQSHSKCNCIHFAVRFVNISVLFCETLRLLWFARKYYFNRQPSLAMRCENVTEHRTMKRLSTLNYYLCSFLFVLFFAYVKLRFVLVFCGWISLVWIYTIY